VAEPLDLAYRVAPLEQPDQLDRALRDVDVMLNAAGPFGRTAGPIADACLRTGTHYLDVTGEVPVIESLRRRDAAARREGLLVMPAIGFDVVPSDCLAAHVANRLPGATHLAVGIRGLGFLTRGSAKSFLEYADQPIRVRRGGALCDVPPGELERRFDYGDGERASCAVSWGDVATAYYTTGIPNVETYLEATPQLRASLLSIRAFGRLLGTPLWQTWMRALADMRPEGPTDAERAAAGCVIVVEATDASGRRAVSRLHTLEAYTTTALCAVRVASHVLKGDLEPGFQTPGRVYGANFILTLPGVRREDVSP
jgi:short subunit dehydrogenase-like uncharacterized protein